MVAFSENVVRAIEELRATFPLAALISEADGNGGARVLVEPIQLSDIYVQRETWIGGHIPVQIPYADVYPLFVRGDLSRVKGGTLGDAMAVGHAFMNRAAVQVSRRSNARNSEIETPALKFLKVIEWIKSR